MGAVSNLWLGDFNSRQRCLALLQPSANLWLIRLGDKPELDHPLESAGGDP
ncbi:hypothetical protein NDI45_20470 [Leptolyngbya sp. GB1-A1]|uniref:hypothetical protein n=1 Tax=Leptolyngbya sp. GB1-A1 TaxID=2933908 RepID=UPI003298D016